MILYKKIGRKYVPVQEHVETTGWSEGDYLVQVHPGVTSIRRLRINPDYPAALAAIESARDAMISAIQEASELKPTNKLNPKQQDAYDSFLKECKGMMFTRASATDIVDAAITELKGKI